MQLKQIPGLSDQSAQAISDHFPNLCDLLLALSTKGPEVVQKIRFGKRKMCLGEKKALTLYNYLFF